MRFAFDIDGVLADVKDYAEEFLVDKKDWDAYFSHTLEFSPIGPMVGLVNTLVSAPSNHTVIFITGRPESNRELTEEWLTNNHIGCNSHSIFLLMRRDGDRRSAVDLKVELVRSAKPDIMFEDDPSVIQALLVKKYLVVQVHGFRYTRSDLVPFCYYRER